MKTGDLAQMDETVVTLETRLALEETLVPTTENARAYRNALGQFSTGVCIVTTSTEIGSVGMTVNSFSSVSLDPPLVLWSLSKSSGRFGAFDDAKHFAIHVAGQHQKELALTFSRNADSFSECDWHRGENDVPLISGCLARFQCTQEAVHDAGDHLIIVGRVDKVTTMAGEPLVFSQGGFGDFVSGN